MGYVGNQTTTSFTSMDKQTITGSGATTYTLSHNVSSESEIEVFVNNIRQEGGSGKAYTVSNNQITFSEAVASSDSIYVVFQGKAIQTVVPPDGSVTSAKLATNIAVSGDLTVDTDTLFVDASNNRVGIGNASPATDLEITGTSVASASLTTDTYTSGTELKIQGDGASFLYNKENKMLRFGTNNLERIRIDADGHVTMPYQCAFSVHKNNSTQSDISVTTHTTISWGAERFDVNSDFDLGAETFTAPVTGKYQLNLNVRLGTLDSANPYYVVKIVTSNSDYSHVFDPDFGQDNTHWGVQVCVLADMDANDTAYVSFYQNNGAVQTDISGSAAYTNFSGYLVC